MESRVHVVSEVHQTNPIPNRGLGLAALGHSDGVIVSSIVLSAWEDRIFVSDDLTDTMIATYLMDTTDTFHTYRVELLFSQYWVFVDGNLVLAGTTSTVPYGLDIIGVEFGDHTIYSGSVSEWTNVRGGSLADIGGPTVPEPSSLVLLGIGGVGLIAAKRRRRNTTLHEGVENQGGHVC